MDSIAAGLAAERRNLQSGAEDSTEAGFVVVAAAMELEQAEVESVAAAAAAGAADLVCGEFSIHRRIIVHRHSPPSPPGGAGFTRQPLIALIEVMEEPCSLTRIIRRHCYTRPRSVGLWQQLCPALYASSFSHDADSYCRGVKCHDITTGTVYRKKRKMHSRGNATCTVSL